MHTNSNNFLVMDAEFDLNVRNQKNGGRLIIEKEASKDFLFGNK